MCFRYYSEAKAQAVTYQAAKQTLFEALEKASLGRWVQKPQEMDEFELSDVTEARPFFDFGPMMRPQMSAAAVTAASEKMFADDNYCIATATTAQAMSK